MIAKLILLFTILLQASKCVLSQEIGRAAILQGKLARLGQFPYVVYIVNAPTVPSNKSVGWLCTGTILTTVWVVTGAHCYSDYSQFMIKLADVTSKVKAGTIDVQKTGKHMQYRESRHHVMMEKNPELSKRLPDVFNNDVLILKVSKPFVFNQFVGTITIAKRPLPEGKKLTCIVVGYGMTEAPNEEKRGAYNSKLYYTFASLDGDKLSCKKRAMKKGDYYQYLYGEELICMDPVDYRSTPCHGDSGGPFVCAGLDVGTSIARLNIHNEQAYCGAPGNYHVYTFLGFYEDWLKRHISDLPPSKLVKVSSRSLRKTEHSKSAGTRFHVGPVAFIDRIPLLLWIMHRSSVHNVFQLNQF